ncbi:hypothetical protein [Streptomyces sp. NPDC007264]|uniref:hypothetical protein n=1 Tax=Streptomyces sp. NPDC007264 TaxID=3364777 RepID=UPI0036DE4732
MSRTRGFTRTARATTTAAAVSLLFVTGLAGVSTAQTGGNPDPRRLAEQAQEGLRKATSIRIGYTDRSTAATSNNRLPTSMSLALDRRGNCAGTLTMGNNGGTVEIIKRDTEVWLKPDGAFWKAELPGRRGIDTAASLAGRYLHGSASDALLSGIADSCNLGTLQKAATVSAPRSLKEGLARAMDHTRVVPLSFTVSGLKSTLYVTTDMPRRLYRATQTGQGTNLTLTFTDYDKPVPTRIPSATETVDIAKVRNQLPTR